jgi:pimeloyl-ACP methyl ester carboxylesterase
MASIRLPEGLSLHCAVDDYLWPWETPTPVLMMHGFARNATFWNRWVPPVADSRRIYRPDLLGCGASDVPAEGYRFTPAKIESEILAVLAQLSLTRVHWVGESSGGIIGLLLAAAYPERIASLVLCNTPTRISDEIRGIYALGQESTASAIRPMAPARGAGKRSATGSTSIIRARRCRNGSSPRWTRPAPTSQPHCTTVSSLSI